MLTQLRHISDGNYNTVFVKNKEHKFNLDKEIYDLECWKKSRNHVYRKEERELLDHLHKLKEQQAYLHNLDEDRGGHFRESQQTSPQRLNATKTSHINPVSVLSTSRGKKIGEISAHDEHNIGSKRSVRNHNLNTAIMPANSATDKRILHRAEAGTNIGVISHLPQALLGKQHHEHVFSCRDRENNESKRSTTEQEHNTAHAVPSVQIGQRRHSLMMQRLYDTKHHTHHAHHQRNTGGTLQHHNHINNEHHVPRPLQVNNDDHQHVPRHVHNHVKMHHHHAHRYHSGYHSEAGKSDAKHNSAYELNLNKIQNDMHHGNVHRHHTHHYGHHRFNSAREHEHESHSTSGYLDHHNFDNVHTHGHIGSRISRQSISHYDPNSHLHGSNHGIYRRRNTIPASLGVNVQDFDTRTRDHELHWDRHQVCKLKGMITDPHYKEKLEDDNGRHYPWSGLYPAKNKTSVEDIENLKSCRYLRFSKLNLMSMKGNPDEEVNVFERRSSAF